MSIANNSETVYKSDDDKITVSVEQRSTVYVPKDSELNEACTYGKIVKLENQSDPKNNGILLATKENSAFKSRAKDQRYPIFRSLDDGKSWEEIHRMVDLVNEGSSVGWQPYLFELPEDVGSFKKGTVIFAFCTRKPNTTVVLHYSLDCGNSWHGLCNVDEGGTSKDWSWSAMGIWEPILKYENGRLYCFYSDELEKGEGPDHIGGHCQRIVYRYTNDLVTWSEKKECVAVEAPNERPGMLSLTKMGNGKWAAVYEHIWGHIYIKFADDLDSWDVPYDGVRIDSVNGDYMWGAPVVAWTPLGGECGTLFATANTSSRSKTDCDLFMSFDYGKTFVSIDNPINLAVEGDYHLYGGYSPGMYVDKEGSLYYVNNPQNKERPHQETLEFVKIKVYG